MSAYRRLNRDFHEIFPIWQTKWLTIGKEKDKEKEQK